jgi:hypothetical protein
MTLVIIVTDYGLEVRGSSHFGGGELFLLYSVQIDSGTYPFPFAIGTFGSFPGSDHSLPFNAEIKNGAAKTRV